MFARPESTGVGPVGHPKRRSAFAIRRLSYLRISTGTAKIINAAASPKTTAARFGRPLTAAAPPLQKRVTLGSGTAADRGKHWNDRSRAVVKREHHVCLHEPVWLEGGAICSWRS